MIGVMTSGGVQSSYFHFHLDFEKLVFVSCQNKLTLRGYLFYYAQCFDIRLLMFIYRPRIGVHSLSEGYSYYASGSASMGHSVLRNDHIRWIGQSGLFLILCTFATIRFFSTKENFEACIGPVFSTQFSLKLQGAQKLAALRFL